MGNDKGFFARVNYSIPSYDSDKREDFKISTRERDSLRSVVWDVINLTAGLEKKMKLKPDSLHYTSSYRRITDCGEIIVVSRDELQKYLGVDEKRLAA